MIDDLGTMIQIGMRWRVTFGRACIECVFWTVRVRCSWLLALRESCRRVSCAHLVSFSSKVKMAPVALVLIPIVELKRSNRTKDRWRTFIRSMDASRY